MVVALGFAYRCHAKCIVGVRLQLVHFDEVLLSSQRRDVCGKTLVILRQDEHFTVRPWDLHDEGSHVLRHRVKPYRNLVAVGGIRGG